ncbi:MAG: hypothetical protein FJ291_09055 [Planctomycetes bacterium]|nr:hypothetical protein [Planctomycetota bacterium]
MAVSLIRGLDDEDDDGTDERAPQAQGLQSSPAPVVDFARWPVVECGRMGCWGASEGASFADASMGWLASKWMTCLTACGAALAAAGEPASPRIAVSLQRPAGAVSPFLFGLSLPAPGTPGADALLPELLRNGSFEAVELTGPKPMPEGWSRSSGWQLFEFGGRHMLVRHDPKPDEPLILLGKRKWRSYRLTLLARKIGGPDGLCVLFDAQDKGHHLRWRLGANGNSQHVLESVGAGEPRPLGPPVPGCIEAGRCYRIDMSLRAEVLRCSLDGRLIHQVGDARFPCAGIGLGATDSTAEYFAIAAFEPKDTPLFRLDNPAKAQLSTIAQHWAPLRDGKNKATFTWDPLYPFNSHFSQCVAVEAYSEGDAGIRQGGIPVAAGETYRGRLYLRGAGRAPLAVSLRRRGGETLAEQKLGHAAGTWAPHDFALTPAESDSEADFCISVAGTGSVWVDQASLAPDRLRSPWALRSDAVAALRALRPTLLCWPAGPAANHHNWQRAVGPADERHVASVIGPSPAPFRPAPSNFGADEFLALCQELRAEPLITLNPGLGNLSCLDLLRYCNGAPDTPLGKQRAANGHRDPYGLRFCLVGGERLDVPGGQGYPVTVAGLASELRGFRPTPQLLFLAGQPSADSPDDPRDARQAGPMATHVASSLDWPPAPEGQAAALAALAATARRLRESSLDVALVDCSLAGGAAAPALGRLLNELSRSGGPAAIAAFRWNPASPLFSARGQQTPAQALWTLFRAHPVAERLETRRDCEGLDAFAGRDGDKVVLRIVGPAERDGVLHVKLDGLGARRLAPRAELFTVPAAVPQPVLPVRGDELDVPLKRGQVAALVVLHLEGEK